ncbi:MAG: hypothetical protein NTW29_04985 [Bacteroidetes bacterium]|nr:hypothetical protein [Bacteroidota bacterium]
MEKFLKEHKLRIIFIIALTFLVIFWGPAQQLYYTSNDIRQFKKDWLATILIGLGTSISLVLFAYVWYHTPSFRQAGIFVLVVCVLQAFYLFIFQDIVLNTVLFLNRQLSRGEVHKTYLASYMNGTEHKKANLLLYDISTDKIIFDETITDKIYQPALKNKDTVKIVFRKGLFGILYYASEKAD